MLRIIKVGTLFLLAAPAPALAATYQWRDDAGIVHFTDDSDRIPDKYLKRATEMESVSAEKKPAATEQHQAAPAAAPAAGGAAAAPAPPGAARGERERLAAELKRIRDALEAKRKELDRLQHKWNVAKGRTPTEEEVEEFEKKRAKGKATFKDNPYVNKNPLSSTIPARAAYYKKLDEVRQDEERARRLEQELQALK